MRNQSENTYSLFELSDGAQLRYKIWRAGAENLRIPRILLLSDPRATIGEYEQFISKVVESGFEVWSFEWRGQGRTKPTLGQKSYIRSYETYIEDLNQFINYIMTTQNDKIPIAFIAHSIGSLIAMRYCAEHPGYISTALLTSSMLDINKEQLPGKIIINFFVIIYILGLKKGFFFYHDNPTTELPKNNKLARDRIFFREIRQILALRPELIKGRVTFGWLRATLESIRILLQQEYIRKITIPIHIIEAGNDRIVNNINLNRICSLMDNCSFEVIPNAKHQLLAELPEIQDRILKVLNELIESIFHLVPQHSCHDVVQKRLNVNQYIRRILKNVMANKKSS